MDYNAIRITSGVATPFPSEKGSGHSSIQNEWISYFLSYRSQKVMVGGKISDSVNVLSGVPQGIILGPLLFICYINDLPNTIKSKIRMYNYVDDSLVYSTISTINNCIQLQRDLKKWSKIHQMEFNPSKCKFLLVTNKMIPLKFMYHIYAKIFLKFLFKIITHSHILM